MSFMGIDGDEIKTIKQDYRMLGRMIRDLKAWGHPPVTAKVKAQAISYFKEQRIKHELMDRILRKSTTLYHLVEERALCIQREDCIYNKTPMNREDFTRALYTNFCLIAEDRFGASLDDLAHMWREAISRDYVD